jgi:uncharacterized membrane protein YdcZ (DUF606 family)
MRQSIRKLWGTVGFIVLIVVYPLAVVSVGANWIASLPWWGSLGVVVVVAAIWLFPAMGLVRWMARPD